MNPVLNEIQKVELKNKYGLELCVSTLGATIISLKVPDKSDKPTNVVVGLEKEEDYLSNNYLDVNLYLGSIIGRYAGRIFGEYINLNSKSYPIYHKNYVHLHGGRNGFDKKIWNVEFIDNDENKPSVTLSYLSPHLEEGYPGNLKVFVSYILFENEFEIKIEATTDETTIVNLTNHSYFNLDGEGTILDHELYIASNKYLEADQQLIPTGKLLPVKNTSFDFRQKRMIKSNNFSGLDNVFQLSVEDQVKASLTSSKTGINMEVFTNQPSIVVFTHPKFPILPFKSDTNYTNYPAICFETQKYPDALNHNHFPNTIVHSNEVYINKSVFKFTTI